MTVERKAFNRYTLAEFIDQKLRPVLGKVKFPEVHVHGTWKPTIADFRQRGGLYLVQSMWRFHTMTEGWSDLGQHATIDPDGYIWEGRSLLVPPASSTNHNDSDNDGIHPFMFEMIGNFDVGQERLEGPQLETAVGLTKTILTMWNNPLSSVIFHREIDTKGKTCPGSGISKPWFVDLVAKYGEEVEYEMKASDANEIINTYLKPAYAAAKTAPERTEIGRLADELRKASGQKPQNA